MEEEKVKRLNMLFEKALSNTVNVVEKRELRRLYSDYINDGRKLELSQQEHSTLKHVAL